MNDVRKVYEGARELLGELGPQVSAELAFGLLAVREGLRPGLLWDSGAPGLDDFAVERVEALALLLDVGWDRVVEGHLFRPLGQTSGRFLGWDEAELSRALGQAPEAPGDWAALLDLSLGDGGEGPRLFLALRGLGARDAAAEAAVAEQAERLEAFARRLAPAASGTVCWLPAGWERALVAVG